MIVPMKKVSLIIKGDSKNETLKKLRKLGIIHIEITEGTGERLVELQDKIALLESAAFTIGKKKKVKQKDADPTEVLSVAAELESLVEEKKQWQDEKVSLNSELDRLKTWGDINPDSIIALEEKGIKVSLYEMPKSEYDELPESVRTVKLAADKSSIKFLLLESDLDSEDSAIAVLNSYRLQLPKMSTERMRQRSSELNDLIAVTDEKIAEYICYADSIKATIKAVENDIEFETYATGMADESLSSDGCRAVSIAYFKGYIEAENLDRLKQTASDNSWGLLVEDPCEEDNVPTKLKNNKFVSLIYPLTDFLGTVPGYFEYDISAWFLAFILIFFGIIFGDGGYGLFICAVAAVPIVKSLFEKKPISPTFLLVGLLGLSTVLWGTLTCTWFGLSPEQLPEWIKSLSVPVISNVYEDKLWSLPWTAEGVGLTTAQNLQILCFSLALIQLTIVLLKCLATLVPYYSFLEFITLY